MKICPSAKDNVDIPSLINEFCENNFYKDDYQTITNYFSDDYVSYEDVVDQMKKIGKIIRSFEE